MHQILAYCIQNAFKGLMTIYYLKGGEGTGYLVGGGDRMVQGGGCHQQSVKGII